MDCPDQTFLAATLAAACYLVGVFVSWWVWGRK